MAIVSPHGALYEYIFDQIGTSLTEDGTTFLFFQQPPENQTNPYIWLNLTTLNDTGPRDSFIYNVLCEFTVVTFADVNRSTKLDLTKGQTALLKLFTTRGLNADFTTAKGDTVRIISQVLSSLEEGSDEQAQKRLNFAKVNVNFSIAINP